MDRLIWEHEGERYVLDGRVCFVNGRKNEVNVYSPWTSDFLLCFAVKEEVESENDTNKSPEN